MKRMILVASLLLALAAAPAAPAEVPPAAPLPPVEAPEPPDPPSPADAWLGLLFGDAVDGGVQVVAVVPGGPADAGGLKDGDLLVALGSLETPNRRALERAIRAVKPGATIQATVIRQGRTVNRPLRIQARRAEPIPFAFAFDTDAIPRGLAVAGMETEPISKELRAFYGAPEDAGVLVTSVELEGEAATAGVKVGDVVVRASGRSARVPLDVVRSFLQARVPKVELEVVRNRKPMKIEVATGHELPEGARKDEIERLGAERRRLQEELRRIEIEMEQLRREER
jgi:S1-C subfamily serine protease